MCVLVARVLLIFTGKTRGTKRCKDRYQIKVCLCFVTAQSAGSTVEQLHYNASMRVCESHSIIVLSTIKSKAYNVNNQAHYGPPLALASIVQNGLFIFTLMCLDCHLT